MGSLGVKPVTIALVGAGIIGSIHASVINDSPDATLIAVVDPTPAGQNLAKTYNCPYFTNIDLFLASAPKPDAAILCTPNDTHIPIGMKLAAAGIHQLIEKPLSTGIDEGRQLLKFCLTNGVRIAVGHHRRQHASVQQAKSALNSGAVGQLIGVSGVWTTLKTDSYFAGNGAWRTGPTGGPVMINLIHEVDLLQYLIGPIVRVYAEKPIATRGHAAEEGAAITLRFRNGVVGTFLLLDNTPSPFSIERGTGENPVFPFTGKDVYRVFGSKGVMSIPDNVIWTPESLEDGWHSEIKETRMEHKKLEVYCEQLMNIVGMVRDGQAPTCSGEAGLAAVAACEAVRKSLATGLPVDVEVFDDSYR